MDSSCHFRVLAAALVLSYLLVLNASDVQAAAVCDPDDLNTGDRIECTEDSTSTDDIDIDLDGVSISTSSGSEPGVKATHEGSGDITIDVTGTAGTDTITTTGATDSDGISANHQGSGDIDINLHSNTAITTSGSGQQGTMGIDIYHQGSGDDDITIDLTGGSITTSGTASRAIRARRDSGSTTDGAAGDVTINLTNSSIRTTATSANNQAIRAENATAGQGDVSVILRNTTVTNGSGNGISGERSNGTGDVILDVDGGSIMTNGTTAYSVYGEHSGTGKIDIDVKNSTLSTNGNQSPSIVASHGGTGGIEIDVNNGTEITTGVDAQSAFGISAVHLGTAADNISITLGGGSTITTHGVGAYGILAQQSGASSTGAVNINSLGTSMITTTGRDTSGIRGQHHGKNDITIDLSGIEIRTESTEVDARGITESHGVWGWHAGTGDVDIDLRGGSIITSGASSAGIYGLHYGGSTNPTGSMGNIEIATHNGHTITTTGTNSHGIVAFHLGSEDDTRAIEVSAGGPVNVSGIGSRGVRIGSLTNDGAPRYMASLGDDGYRRQTVTVNAPITSAGEGVYMAGGGRVIIGPRGSINSTRGIAILALGTVPEDDSDMNNVIPAIPPKLRVDLNLGGRRIAQVLNDGWIINDGGETTLAVNNTVLHDGVTGVTGNTARNGVWDVTMLAEGVNVSDYSNADPSMWTITQRAENVIVGRDFSTEDFEEARVRCPSGQTGFPNCRVPPPQDVVHRVDTRLQAGPEMVAGVHIEGNGEVYIGAQGSIEAASGIAILADGDAPELLVDLQLDGRRVAEVLGDDWIINDGGETTIVVNDVKLHDGQTGVVPGVSVANGVWDVTMLAEGVNVSDYSNADPSMWTITQRAENVIAGRDFSTADFIETSRDLMEPGAPIFMEEYAPRAALYEALPDVLLGLQGGALSGAHRQGPTTPAWIRLFGRHASQDFERSTVGASYDADSLTFEAGATVWHTELLDVQASLHRLEGSADVSSPNRGGDIDVEGKGLSVDAHWRNPGNAYLTGRISWTDYNLDLSSDTVGGLVSSLDADGYAMHVEAGHRRLWGTHRHFTPRVWLEHARISIDGFTDAVDARASFPEEERTTAGIGVLAETVQGLSGGEWRLHGSVDVEHTLSGARTRTTVSREHLGAESEENSVRIGLGSVWQRGDWHYRASLSTREALGAGGNDHAGAVQVGMVF